MPIEWNQETDADENVPRIRLAAISGYKYDVEEDETSVWTVHDDEPYRFTGNRVEKALDQIFQPKTFEQML